MICINCIRYVITLRYDHGVLKRGVCWANCYRVKHNYHSHLIKSTTDDCNQVTVSPITIKRREEILQLKSSNHSGAIATFYHVYKVLNISLLLKHLLTTFEH